MIVVAVAAIYLCTAVPGVAGADDSACGALTAASYDFESFEGVDGWNRRKGPAFPPFIAAEIDSSQARSGKRSLKFAVNGGQVAMYSPATRIDPLHTYVFRGFIRAESLDQGAAIVSLSFLNYKRQRIQRFLTAPVCGSDQEGWVEVRIDPVTPDREARFAVIGCHLLDGEGVDVTGGVWFDDLWLGKLPQLAVAVDSQGPFLKRDTPLTVVSTVGGLDIGSTYRLLLELHSVDSGPLAKETRDLAAADSQPGPDGSVPLPTDVKWELPPQDYGYYEVRSALERDGTVILERRTSIAVLRPVEPGTRGEFGWSVPNGFEGLAPERVVETAVAAGIHWVKLPLWQTAAAEDRSVSLRTSKLLAGLSREQITLVGVLQDPPAALREKFAADWSGMSEIFTTSPEVWGPSLLPVVAQYSAKVRHWQLGGDEDKSFVGLPQLPQTLSAVKRELDKIGGDAIVGVPWEGSSLPPVDGNTPRTFVSIAGDEPFSAARGEESFVAVQESGPPRWAVVRPLSRFQCTNAEQAGDFAKRLVAAKLGGASVVFASDVFDSERGLLDAAGAPTPLFLPWRTAATALGGAEFLGSLTLPGGSVNYAFARGEEVGVVVWRNGAEREGGEAFVEEAYLGEKIVVQDLWGREQTVETGPRGQRFRVGRQPVLISGCLGPIVRWQIGTKFLRGEAESAYKAHNDAVTVRNTFPQGVSGTATLVPPPGWKVEPATWSFTKAAGEEFRHDFTVTLPPQASLGFVPMAIDFDLVADRRYRFRVHRLFRVGLGDVSVVVVDRKLPDGKLEIEQTIINKISPAETLNFRCTLFVPGQKYYTATVNKLGRGEDRKLYVLDDADALAGKEFWLRAEQIGGRRVLNYRWRVGENWSEH